MKLGINYIWADKGVVLYGRKKKEKTKLKYYRLYGCYFTEEEYIFIKSKLRELQTINGQKRGNTQILVDLFKLALEDESKVRGWKIWLKENL